MRRPGGQASYPCGWRRSGYLVPKRAAGAIDAFEKRWRWRFGAHLVFALALMVAFGPWGILAGWTGGALVALLYVRSVRGAFSGFEVAPPDPSRSSVLASLKDWAEATSYAALLRRCAGGLIMVAIGIHSWQKNNGSYSTDRLFTAFFLLFFSFCTLVATSILALKVASQRKSGGQSV